MGQGTYRKKQIQDSKVERETEKERMFKEIFRKKGTSKGTKERNRQHKDTSQGRQGGSEQTDPWKMQEQTEEDMIVRSGPAELRSQRLRKGGF